MECHIGFEPTPLAWKASMLTIEHQWHMFLGLPGRIRTLDLLLIVPHVRFELTSFFKNYITYTNVTKAVALILLSY